MGRFAVQSGNPLQSAMAPNLDGKRIGALKGSAYEAWLKAYYTSASIAAFDSLAEAQEALRTGNVDAVFADTLLLIYWVTGEASRGCCRLLDNAFSDFDHFSRNIAFLVRNDRADLRAFPSEVAEGDHRCLQVRGFARTAAPQKHTHPRRRAGLPTTSA